MSIEDDLQKMSISKSEDPKTPMNWNGLPNEMKTKCLEKCDWKSRIHVAMTSQNEKALIEKLKPIEWEAVKILVANDEEEGFGDVFVDAEGSEGEMKMEFSYYCDSVATYNISMCIAYLFKLGDVKYLQINESDTEDEVPQELFDALSSHAPFNFPSGSFRFSASSLYRFFIENSDGSIQKINMNSSLTRYNQNSIFNGFCEKIFVMTPQIQMDLLTPGDGLSKAAIASVLQGWVQNDAPLGTRLIFKRYHLQNVFDVVRMTLSDDMVGTSFVLRKSGEAMTKNAKKTKTILMRHETVDGDAYISCVVVASKLRPQQLEKAADWFWRAPDF